MNKRERVIAAFHGQETDHVPVCMWQHMPERFWGDDDQFAAEQARWFRNTDVDFMKLSGDKFFGWPSPVLNGITSAEDLFKVEPLGADHPYIRGQIERTKKVVDALNGECVSIYLIFVPLSCIRLAIGYPMMMKLIRENPEAMKHACDVVAEDLKLLVRGIIQEAGADGIFYSVQNGEENRFTAEEYRDWVMPSDRKVLDYANSISDMNAIHFCAWEALPNRLDVWKDYKAPVISWSRYFDIMDIGKAKWRFGTTVWGGFDNRPGTFLYTASREEIEAEVARLIEQGGKKGYILGSDCSIYNELPEERIRWVVEAARRI
ncbi:MAG: uroporphyrinogen decarboxylase family protein [Clostridia bacterium]|nr:uroporphyrinogen decarboxylase family protein [Clostridia bacterium]